MGQTWISSIVETDEDHEYLVKLQTGSGPTDFQVKECLDLIRRPVTIQLSKDTRTIEWHCPSKCCLGEKTGHLDVTSLLSAKATWDYGICFIGQENEIVLEIFAANQNIQMSWVLHLNELIANWNAQLRKAAAQTTYHNFMDI